MRSASRASHARPAAGRGLSTKAALYVGTSGFSYPTWKGKFYPSNLSGSKMLGYYAERFNGVELNGSFYRTPPQTALEKWAAETPAGFRFCMKANRGLTYSADTFDRVGLARILAGRLAPLADRLGPILLQFPPVRLFNPALLDSLLGALATPVAAEFRHESWFRDETYAVLRRHRGALVITDEEKWPRAPMVRLGSMAYYRLRRGYTAAALRPWIAEVTSALAEHEQVHVYFKHDPESPALAQRLMRQALKAAGQPAGAARRRRSSAVAFGSSASV